MTEFRDPLGLLISLYSHVDATNHRVNLTEESRHLWVGFSCADCNDGYKTWTTPIESHFEYPEIYDPLVKLMCTLTGRTKLQWVINQYSDRRRLISTFRAEVSPENEINALEKLWVPTMEYETVILNLLDQNYRSGIKSRYLRDPVI
jgi:hypothetical protein